MKNLIKGLAVLAMAVTGFAFGADIDIQNDQLTFKAYNCTINAASSSYGGDVVSGSDRQTIYLLVGDANANVTVKLSSTPLEYGYVIIGNGYASYSLDGLAVMDPCQAYTTERISVAPNKSLYIPIRKGMPAGTEIFSGHLKM